MKIPDEPERWGVAATLVVVAILLVAASVGAAYYYVALGSNSASSATSQSVVSTNCGNSTNPQSNQSSAAVAPCSSGATSSTSTILSSGSLTISDVNLVSICYVGNCGDLPIMYLSFDLINVSQTNGTIVSLTLTCMSCGIGAGTNSEGYSLAARVGGYDNKSAYKCDIAGSEFDNVPPGNTSYSMTCYGPGSAWITYPYQFGIEICIPANVSSVGTCLQNTTNLLLTVNAAPYGSHLLPRHPLEGSLAGLALRKAVS